MNHAAFIVNRSRRNLDAIELLIQLIKTNDMLRRILINAELMRLTAVSLSEFEQCPDLNEKFLIVYSIDTFKEIDSQLAGCNSMIGCFCNVVNDSKKQKLRYRDALVLLETNLSAIKTAIRIRLFRKLPVKIRLNFSRTDKRIDIVCRRIRQYGLQNEIF